MDDLAETVDESTAERDGQRSERSYAGRKVAVTDCVYKGGPMLLLQSRWSKSRGWMKKSRRMRASDCAVLSIGQEARQGK